MDVVFLIYGLSFLLLGVTILIRNVPDSEFEVSRMLWLLAGFAFVHGALEWTELWRIVRGDLALLAAARPVILFVSYLFLFEFGRRLTLSALPASNRALGAWIYAPMLLAIVGSTSLSDQPAITLGIVTRYFLGLSAAWLSAAGCYFYCRRRLRASVLTSDFPAIHFACDVAVAAFVAYGILAGLVVPRADWFPASAVNEEGFLAALGIPVQVLRATCAVAIALSVGGLLRVFDIESRHQLHEARNAMERAAAEARQRERRMRALIDATTESVVLLDPHGRMLAVNRIAAQRFGKSVEELVGKSLFDLLPEELAESRRAVLRHVVASGEPAHHADRRGTMDFDHHVFPVINDAGMVESVAIYARDVSETLRTQRLDAMFHRIDLMQLKWRMDLSNVAQAFCEELCLILALEAAWIARAEPDGTLELVGSSGRSAAFLESVRRNCRRWDAQPSSCLPARATLGANQPRLLQLTDPSCAPCRSVALAAGIGAVFLLPINLRGKPWGMVAFYASSFDFFQQEGVVPRITALGTRIGVSLESAVQQEWLTLMDTALSTTGTGIFITDAAGRILWLNPSFSSMSGYAGDEILGKTPGFLRSGVHEESFYRRFWETIGAGTIWRGEVVNARRDGSLYTVHQTVTPLLDKEGRVTHFISTFEDISEKKAVEERIRHMANFDALTDLPNRVMVFDRLGQALALARREGHRVAVLFLDLDRFKEINATFGHKTGDLLLRSVAERLCRQVRETDTVARLSGDEFLIMLPHVAGADDARLVADKIIAAIALPFDLAAGEASVGISVGIALFPDHGNTGDELVNAADAAMYCAKQAGRNRAMLFAATTSA